MRTLVILLSASASVCAQRPVIFPGGVVNAASYAAGGQTGKALSPASLVSIFGSDLAAREQAADGFPLPTTLGGTSVTLNGVPVPILYVSPRQINIQLSTVPVPVPPPTMDPARLVVVTAAGVSEPALLPGDSGGPFGIFTLDGSGCGRGAVLNIASDGSVSLNSPSNSASPGDYVSVYGTGLGAVFNPPPAGSPAPSDPPSLAMSWGLYTGVFDLVPSAPPTPLWTRVSWAGRAPGFVGLDQVNIRIPDSVREGCGVPLTIGAAHAGQSQPVPISIRRGGGACVDPPTAGYGQIEWERTEASGTNPSGISETFTAAFPASPGKQPPPQITPPVGVSGAVTLFGPSCPLPGYTNLDAGRLTIEGPGFGPVEAPAAVVDGQRVYRTVLPAGTIRSGSFGVTAGGGEVGSFQSSVRIGSGINITSSFPPGTVVRLPGTGGPQGLPVKLDWGRFGHLGEVDVGQPPGSC
jgi:uncharacterized protein (TIGR03437 family)